VLLIFDSINFQRMKYIFTTLLLSITAITTQAQATLTIENNSQRNMTVKVMRGTTQGSLHKTVSIAPFGSATVNFYETGNYFTKTKAVLAGRDPIYQKGKSFHVTNDDTGYSVLTITYTIKESAVPQATGGTPISKTEFDQN